MIRAPTFEPAEAATRPLVKEDASTARLAGEIKQTNDITVMRLEKDQRLRVCCDKVERIALFCVREAQSASATNGIRCW